jgi:RimJ/RimL family protein N-acetyltransferase
LKAHTIGPETERLLHRVFVPEDAEAFFRLKSDLDVIRLTGDPPIESVDASRAAITAHPDFGTVGYGRWACVLKETNRIIGFCGLKYLPEFDVVDIGYRFFPEFWGRGVATEACIASLSFGFDTLQLDKIVGFVLPANAGSIRVLEKIGMRHDGEVEYDGLLALRYSIERS